MIGTKNPIIQDIIGTERTLLNFLMARERENQGRQTTAALATGRMMIEFLESLGPEFSQRSAEAIPDDRLRIISLLQASSEASTEAGINTALMPVLIRLAFNGFCLDGDWEAAMAALSRSGKGNHFLLALDEKFFCEEREKFIEEGNFKNAWAISRAISFYKPDSFFQDEPKQDWDKHEDHDFWNHVSASLHIEYARPKDALDNLLRLFFEAIKRRPPRGYASYRDDFRTKTAIALAIRTAELRLELGEPEQAIVALIHTGLTDYQVLQKAFELYAFQQKSRRFLRRRKKT